MDDVDSEVGAKEPIVAKIYEVGVEEFDAYRFDNH